MAKLLYGDHIGATAALRVGSSAVIFDQTGEKILLMQRSDNGQWCLPGGGLDAGEDVETCIIREVREETGLTARVIKLVGVYSTPHRITEYADGNRIQIIALHFLAERVSGELTLNDEALALGYFALDELDALDLMQHHRERIADTLAGRESAFVK